MKKIMMDGDSIVIDGIELSKEKIKEIMTENVVLRRQINLVRTNFGGVSNE